MVKRQASQGRRPEERAPEVNRQHHLLKHDGVQVRELRYDFADGSRCLGVSRAAPRAAIRAGVFEMNVPDVPVGIGSLGEASRGLRGAALRANGDGRYDVGEKERAEGA